MNNPGKLLSRIESLDQTVDFIGYGTLPFFRHIDVDVHCEIVKLVSEILSDVFE